MQTLLINKQNRHLQADRLAAMYRHRKALFVDRLSWTNMVVTNDEERDEADADPEVVYLVTVDKADRLVGSCRLTPTVGECLLGGPLANYLETPLERNAMTWELTRFAPASDPANPLHGRSFANLAAGVLEWALKNDVSKIFGIADPPLMGIAGGLGWRIEIEGPPVAYETGKSAFAFSFPVDEPTLETTKKALRLDGKIITDSIAMREAAA